MELAFACPAPAVAARATPEAALSASCGQLVGTSRVLRRALPETSPSLARRSFLGSTIAFEARSSRRAFPASFPSPIARQAEETKPDADADEERVAGKVVLQDPTSSSSAQQLQEQLENLTPEQREQLQKIQELISEAESLNQDRKGEFEIPAWGAYLFWAVLLGIIILYVQSFGQ